jgi:hypothetical protein
MGDNPVRCRIPELLSRIRQTQEWLASETSHSRQQISDIINMRNGRVVSVRKGRKIALRLKCHIDDLYEWD